MRPAPRLPRAQVVALSQPDPLLLSWRAWWPVLAALAILLAGLVGR
jgi:hypothetical protein